VGFWTLWNNTYYVLVVINVAMLILEKDFGPYGIILMSTCCRNFAMIMVLRDFEPYDYVCLLF
jgi:hypothetical protein